MAVVDTPTMVKTIDEQISHQIAPGDEICFCRLRVWQAEGMRTVVIVYAIDAATRQALADNVAAVANSVWKRIRRPARGMAYVEHSETDDTFDRVSFDGATVLSNPCRERLHRTEVEVMVGGAATI